jgi:Zn-dependent metalloprotease
LSYASSKCAVAFNPFPCILKIAFFPVHSMLLLVLSVSCCFHSLLSFSNEVVTKDFGKSKKVLTFPAQLKLHREYKKDQNATNDNILTMDEFMAEYLNLLGVTKESIILHHEERLSVGTTVLHYQQLMKGYPVYGAKVIITTGRHLGVMKANGDVLGEISSADLDVTTTVQVSAALENLNLFIIGKYGCKNKVNIDTTVEELVFHRNLGGRAPGSPILAHHIKGSSIVDVEDKNLGIVFDAFVDAKTGKIIDFLSRDSL